MIRCSCDLLKHLEPDVREEMDSAIAEALESVKDARAELEGIERELVNAREGKPYEDIGEVRGVSAGAIFRAFGRREQLDALRREIERRT